MGLFKRMVVALEKIANKEEDFSAMGKVLEDAMRVQADMQLRNAKVQRREGMKDRYKMLLNKQKTNTDLTIQELTEIEIGKEMFD